jgi:hypothetical protein
MNVQNINNDNSLKIKRAPIHSFSAWILKSVLHSIDRSRIQGLRARPDSITLPNRSIRFALVNKRLGPISHTYQSLAMDHVVV